MIIRLDKLLADSGYGSRSQVKKLLKNGAVTVDGLVEKDSSIKVDLDKSVVCCDGEIICFSQYEYYLLYKPGGIITASRDKQEKTVVDLIESKKRRDLSPVGRLDRDTEGLLLITNDGQLAHKLLAPGKHVEKVYLALISGTIPENAVELFDVGLDIGDDKPTMPARLKIYDNPLDTADKSIIEKVEEYPDTRAVSIGLTEGRYHEIKRMFEVLGCKVEYLKRISMGGLVLNNEMEPGDYTSLSQDEIYKVFGIK
ncbi:MAG: rRNA pseudouridine synthase [Eubacterium sp.]|nr:rRNA pseudouridine synthase [Eubacterium sp.]